MEEKQLKQIDFIEIFKKIKSHILLFVISIPVTAVLSYLLICCVPRYYVCTVKLAPELSSLSNESLNSLASSFGVDLDMGNNKSPDAIVPELYPDLMSSVDFRTSMFDVKVKNKDNTINTTYYDYLLRYQKSAWWEKILGWIKSKLETEDASDSNSKGGSNGVNPFRLTKQQSDIAAIVGGKISCFVDKKTNVISISATDQDPLISAVIADTATAKLQAFITEYRTKKARTDVEYAKKLYTEAKAKYEKTRRLYAAYNDANTDVTLPSVKSKMEDIENDMQLQYNSYTALSTQLQQAQAKLVEQTPAFTTLQSATVPIKPAGPKRMMFAIVMVGLVFVIDLLIAIGKGSIK